MINVAFENLFRSLAQKPTMLEGDTEKNACRPKCQPSTAFVVFAMLATRAL